ncbi:MAG: hypothetical protein WCS97_01575 [Candidatus Paceibacterota bacterium]
MIRVNIIEIFVKAKYVTTGSLKNRERLFVQMFEHEMIEHRNERSRRMLFDPEINIHNHQIIVKLEGHCNIHLMFLRVHFDAERVGGFAVSYRVSGKIRHRAH